MASSTLLYIQAPLLDSSAFLRPFFANLHKLPGQLLLVHGAMDEQPQRTAFTTKRLSANLSEQMVDNLAFSAHQRGLVTYHEGRYSVATDKLRELHSHARLIILNSLVATGTGGQQARPAHELLEPIRVALGIQHVLLFANNPASALTAEPRTLADDATYEKLLAAYPEEEAALRLAHSLRPATLLSPEQLGQLAASKA